MHYWMQNATFLHIFKYLHTYRFSYPSCSLTSNSCNRHIKPASVNTSQWLFVFFLFYAPTPVPCHQTAHNVRVLPSLQRNNSSVTKDFYSGELKCKSRGGMEESYETFQEELWPPRADASLKPVQRIRRAEMYTSRKIKEETPLAPLQPKSEPKSLPREPSTSKLSLASLQKPMSTQNLMQTETPWENVTLNRCLFVAITILVLTSGFQKLHEAFRGQGTTEQGEAGLMIQSRLLHHRGALPEPETSLWDSMFWWLPSLDDEDEDDEDIKRRKSKRGASRGLRNKPLPDKKLLKQRDGKLKDRRAKKARDDKIKDKKGKVKIGGHEDAADEEDERDEEAVGKTGR
nr:junctional sarcoplasmic reticulum protein 1 [Nothobranchius furzeri]